MSSKKTSQAQPPPGPPQPPPGGSPAQLPFREEPRPRRALDAAMRFECPTWPPRMPQVSAELTELLASGAWGHYQAETLERLRGQIREFLGFRHVRLVCSGSAAIELALRACGVGADPRLSASGSPSDTPGDPIQEVICPVLDYPGNVRAVRLLGAVPVLVDTAPGRWTIDPEAVLAAATPRTVAVIASHLYGEIAAVETLREICDAHRWTLVEDVCQMPGGTLGGRPLGSFGHVAAWSFGGSKPLTAGCGGAITTADDRIAQRLAAHADRPSDAFPLSPLQAAVLIPQWAALSEFGRRQRAAVLQLVEACRAQTPHWRWPRGEDQQRQAVFYKLPIVVGPEWAVRDGSLSSSQSFPADLARDGTVAPLIRTASQCGQAASQCGIPGGEPFRIPARVARSRGRIESSANARAITARTWLIDHRALAGNSASIDQLAEVLIGLHGRLIER